MIVTRSEMLEIEQRAFNAGWSSAQLMSIVADGMSRALLENYGEGRLCVIYAGRGHNAGDAFATARRLVEHGWRFSVRTGADGADFAPLTRTHRDALAAETRLNTSGVWSARPPILLDGLLGLGGAGPLRGGLANLAREMRDARETSGARVVAMDIPSGLDADTGRVVSQETVVADLTLTVGFCKTALIADAAVDFTGQLAVIPCPPFDQFTQGLGNRRIQIAQPASLRSWSPRRRHSEHKGQFGRLTIIAGSPGMHGAAILCANAATRAGAGLVTVVCHADVASEVAAACTPEAMIRGVTDFRSALELRSDALAIGPGIAPEFFEQIADILREAESPAVIDAGAIRAVASRHDLLVNSRALRWVLTPHEGEMECLSPRQGRDRITWATHSARECGVPILLKGARTITAAPSGDSWVNPTGNAGMASGGMGDTLTGVIGALLARGLPPDRAAALGAWVCGSAADQLVETGKHSHESLLASDVAAGLGLGFDALRHGTGLG